MEPWSAGVLDFFASLQHSKVARIRHRIILINLIMLYDLGSNILDKRISRELQEVE